MDEYFTVLANGQSSGEVFDEREDATAWLAKHAVGDVEDPEGDGKRWEDDLSAVDLGEDIKARNMARRSEERKKQMEEVAKNAATPEEVRTILLGNK